MGPGEPPGSLDTHPPSGVDLMSTGVSISLANPSIPKRGGGRDERGESCWCFFHRSDSWENLESYLGWMHQNTIQFLQDLEGWGTWLVRCLMNFDESPNNLHHLHRWPKYLPPLWFGICMDPGTNSKQICFDEQSEKISANFFRSFSTEPYNIYNMKGARRINEPTTDPSLSKRPLYFTSWALSLRTQNSLSPRYLGFDTPPIFRGREFFHVPKLRLCKTKADPFFKIEKAKKKLLINVSTWPFLVRNDFQSELESHLAVSLFGSWKKMCFLVWYTQLFKNKINPKHPRISQAGSLRKCSEIILLAGSSHLLSGKYWLITMISNSPEPGQVHKNRTKKLHFLSNLLKTSASTRCSRTMRVTRLRKSSASSAGKTLTKRRSLQVLKSLDAKKPSNCL